MIAGIADTRTALWYMFGDARLSTVSIKFIDDAADRRRAIELAPISLAELVSCPLYFDTNADLQSLRSWLRFRYQSRERSGKNMAQSRSVRKLSG